MSFAQLESQFRRIHHMHHVAAILQWDEAVMMPAAAGDERAAAMATLGVVVHEHLTAPQVADWLEAAEQEARAGKLDVVQRANLREIRRVLKREACIRAACGAGGSVVARAVAL